MSELVRLKSYVRLLEVNRSKCKQEIKRLTAEVDAYQQHEDEIIVALGSRGILSSEILSTIKRLTAEVKRLGVIATAGECLYRQCHNMKEVSPRWANEAVCLAMQDFGKALDTASGNPTPPKPECPPNIVLKENEPLLCCGCWPFQTTLTVHEVGCPNTKTKE